MKVLSRVIAALMAMSSHIADASQAETIGAGSVTREHYLYCNVYASEVCFGIGEGDQVQMELPSDFTVYRVKLASNLQATIYDGFNPDIENKDLKKRFEACMERGKECILIERFGGELEAVVAFSSKSNIAHIRLRGISESNRIMAEEFLSNIRPCTNSGAGVTCQDVSLFGRSKAPAD